MLHNDRQRAQSFGADPEQYDRSRPSYPDALLDFLMTESPRIVLDVGCGTGIASRQLQARGCEVLGVEPDGRMAAVAQRSGVEVEVAAFEAWDPAGRTFDLLACGQAWHWVEPVAGATKAVEVVRPGGRVALFWNTGRHDETTRAALDPAYASANAEVEEHARGCGGAPPDTELAADRAFEATGRFGPVERRVFDWSRRYSTAEWLDQLPTHSGHRILRAEDLTRLAESVGAAIDDLGGGLVVHYSCELLTAIRL